MKLNKKSIVILFLISSFLVLAINIGIIPIKNSNDPDQGVNPQNLNDNSLKQSDDFEPIPDPPNENFKWNFWNGTTLGFKWERYNTTDYSTGVSIFNISSMPLITVKDNPFGYNNNFSYCVQLEELYFNTTYNKLIPIENQPLLNVSLVNMTKPFFIPKIPKYGPTAGWFFQMVNPFLPTNGTTLAVEWSFQVLEPFYQWITDGPPDFKDYNIPVNYIYYLNMSSNARVWLDYDDNGILETGYVYYYDDTDGWTTVNLTRVYNLLPLDEITWAVEEGDVFYLGVSRNEFKIEIDKIQNVSHDFGGGFKICLQEVWANMSYYNHSAFKWERINFDGIDQIIIGIANEEYPYFPTGGITLPFLFPTGFDMADVVDMIEMMADEDPEYNIVTSGANWFQKYNSSTQAFSKWQYNASGMIELIRSEGMEFFGDVVCGGFRKKSTVIDTGLHVIDIETLGTNDFNVTLNISVTVDNVHLLYSAFNVNPINLTLNYGAIFIDLWVNNSAALDTTYSAINVTIEFDASKYKNMELWYFNVSSYDPLEAWKKIPFTTISSGKIVFSVNHTSYFAFTNAPIGAFLPGRGDDDDDDEKEAPAIPIGNYYLIFIAIAVIGLVIYKKREIFKK